MFVVESLGRSGGLALFWDEAAGVSIQNYSRRHINAVISPMGEGAPWKFMGFYRHPNVSKRHDAWGLFWYLATLDPATWLCARDFDEIADLSKIFGGAGRAARQMNAFRETLAHCELLDLGSRGPIYTWNNGEEWEAFTQEKLGVTTQTLLI
jgi:hypothetical protein